MRAAIPSVRETFSRNLTDIAASRGISRAALARRSGRSRSHLLEVLAERRSVGIDCAAAFAWAVEVECRTLFRDDVVNVAPRLTCRLSDAPEDARGLVAKNSRALMLERFGRIDVAALARAAGWHRSDVYALLSRRFSLCIDKLEKFATGLDATTAALLRS
jgi:antitoxin component HigA of HigAB toxin-antitoxin module